MLDHIRSRGEARRVAADRARLTAAADSASARAAEARALGGKEGSRVEDVAAARAQVATAEGRLDQAKATLERRLVRAPFAGEVLKSFAISAQRDEAPQKSRIRSVLWPPQGPSTLQYRSSFPTYPPMGTPPLLFSALAGANGTLPRGG